MEGFVLIPPGAGDSLGGGGVALHSSKHFLIDPPPMTIYRYEAPLLSAYLPHQFQPTLKISGGLVKIWVHNGHDWVFTSVPSPKSATRLNHGLPSSYYSKLRRISESNCICYYFAEVMAIKIFLVCEESKKCEILLKFSNF